MRRKFWTINSTEFLRTRMLICNKYFISLLFKFSIIRLLIDIKFLRIFVVKLSQNSSKMLDKRYRLSNRVFIVFSFYQIVEIEFVEELVWNFIDLENLVVFNDFDFVEFLCDFHFHVLVQFNIFNSIEKFRRLWRLRASFSLKIESFQKKDVKDVVNALTFEQI